MIEKLRRKFIALSVLTVSAVVLTIISGINIMNYERVKERADIVLEVLWKNDGHFPKIIENMSPETKYRTRYFSVLSDEEGSYMRIDTVNIAAKTRTEVAEYALEVMKKGGADGFIDGYRYMKAPKGDSEFIVFIDCSQDLEIFYSFLRASLIISFLGLLVIFSIIVIYSKRLVAPAAESYEKQKRFITDVSHELKTPLAIINTNTDVIEMTEGESEWTASIHRQIKRLSDMITGMTALARMDEGGTDENRNEFSISEAAEEVIENFRPLAADKGIDIISEIEEGIAFTGVESSIKQLFSIGLDNAVKYDYGNGPVSFSLKKKDRKTVIEIKNRADNIEKGNMDYVFERFFRMDKSRNSEKEGYGIGLSIAESIVRNHRGKITAYSDDGEYFILKIIF